MFIGGLLFFILIFFFFSFTVQLASKILKKSLKDFCN